MALDPIYRPVSVARINGSIASTKKMFDETGLDFYNDHAYEFSEDKFVTIPKEFGPAKPLTFTEWGWEDAGHGGIFYERDFDDLLEQTEAGNVAGHVFWSWNDMRQYTREDWATHDGILLSGAATEDREYPRADLLQVGCLVCRAARNPAVRGPRRAPGCCR